MQPVLLWKRKRYYVCWVRVCIISYPACNARAPYCHVACPALQYFSASPHKLHDFRENSTEDKMCVLFFSTTIVWNISHTETNWEADDQNVYWSQCKVSVILQFSRQVFEKYSNIQFNVKPPSGIRIVPWGQTDRQTNMTKLIVFFFLQYCERAWAQDSDG